MSGEVAIAVRDKTTAALGIDTTAIALPQLVIDAGPDAVERFLEFFAAQLANDQTREAYARAAGQFLTWCEARGLSLRALAPLHVAAYIRTHRGSVPTVKQHLAAIRVLCDWLVVSQILPANPAAAVRGPKHVVTTGSTPVLTAGETRALLDRITLGSIVGLRDRALIGVLIYSFARIGAAISLKIEDYYPEGKRWWLVSTRRAASATRFLHITSPRRTSTPTSTKRICVTIAKGGYFDR